MVHCIAPLDPAAAFAAGPVARTYGDLFGAAHAVAERLRGSACERVVLAARSRFAFAAGLFGAWEAGLAVELPPNVQEQTLADLDAQRGIVSLHDAPEGPPSILGEVLARIQPSERPLTRLAQDAELLVLHTSGSTRAARTVTKTTRHLEREVAALANAFGHPGMRSFSSVPFLHLYGLLFGLLLPVAHGGVIVDEEALYPSDIARILGAREIDLFVSTPTHLRTLLASKLPVGTSVVSSGARLDPSLHLGFAVRHEAKVIDVLGSSETGGIASRSSPLTRWTPLAGVVVRAAPDGTMLVSSPWSGATHSGDRVRVEVDGSFEHLGRSEDVIKVAGKRLEVAALEGAILGVHGVVDVAVFAEEDEVRGARIYVAYAPDSVEESAVRTAISRQFDPVFSPRRVRAAEALPRDATGKLPRERLRDWFGIKAPVLEESTREVSVSVLGDATYRVHVPKNYIFFRGHFDRLPLLPGVAQLSEIVLPLVRRSFPDLGRVERARRLRFRRPLFPDQALDVRLERVTGGVKFELSSEGAPVASGTLSMRGRATP